MRLVLLFLMVFYCSICNAQLPFINSHSFEHEYQGLKISKVYTDHEGFIWFVTQLGLFQYDGMNVVHINLPDSSSDQTISVIYSKPSYGLFVGTKQGELFQLRENRLIHFDGYTNITGSSISAIAIGSNASVWIGTNGGGISLVLNGHQYDFTAAKDGLIDNNINCIEEFNDSQIWFGTDGGITIGSIVNGFPRLRPLKCNTNLPDPMVTFLKTNTTKEMLIGTQSKGVFVFNTNRSQIVPILVKDDWSFGSIKGLITQGRQLWVATEESGLLFIENNRIRGVFNQQNTKINNRINSIAEDRSGSIWIADKSENILSANNLFSYLQLPSKRKGPIQCLGIDSETNLWVGDRDGICLLRNGQFVELPSNISGVKAVSIYIDSLSNIWLGTFGEGVYVFQPKTKRLLHFNEKSGLINNNVISITGNKEQIWFATFGGISCYEFDNGDIEKGVFAAFTSKYGLPQSYYYQVFMDSKGGVWFTTDGIGVSRLLGHKLTHYGVGNGLESKVVNAICEDSKGNIWLNSPELGLYKFASNKFVNFGTKEGVREKGYANIIADNGENLIYVNGKGIDMLNIHSGNILYHDKEIGFEGVSKDTRVICKDKLGKVWIGSGRNIVCYDPRKNHLWEGPKPILKSVHLFEKEIHLSYKRVFSSDENSLSFDYVGIWYHLPEEVNYLIKLEGYDADWIRSRNLQASYPKLAPGKYEFKIKALPSNNFKTSKMLTYSFEIKKPFYETFWFYGLILIIGGFILRAFFYFRFKQLKAKEKISNDAIKFQFETLRSQVNPHFLFNSFNTLSGIIEKNPEHAVEYVEHLSDFFRNILQYKEKDLITLSEELSILNDYLFIQKNRFGENLLIEILPELRDSVCLIAPMTLQILVENAIKHNVVSKAHPLKITIEKMEDDYLLISNPIQAKTTLPVSTQIGLKNIVERYAILQARRVLVERSTHDFIVKIPLIKNEKNTHH
ncbi:MAG: hypothetical protein CFE21_14695 [Bacteroidetes bacterium B1(2017)]|nr:MAG: hypothetical protein CFE21_14695 [Bacteroidetes bacterium B1(2017)]